MILSRDKTKILMLTHYTFRAEDGEDTDQRILRYLKDRVKKVALITHPFPEYNGRYSYLKMYQDGNLVLDKKVAVFKGPYVLEFLYHILITYYFLFLTGFTYDLCIALENLSFISIYPMRMVNSFKRIVYYAFDFVPKRYGNPVLNWIYYFIYKFACRNADLNWVMAQAQIEANKTISINSSTSNPFDIVPIGYEPKEINILPSDKIKINNIVYAGGFREGYGPQLAIKALPLIAKKLPKITLTIIGIGKYENELRKLIKQLKVEKYIDFKGFIPSFKDLTSTLTYKSIGLAPYAPIPGSNSYHSDPSKVKLYMSCGLPVITTNVNTISKLILKTGSGIVIDYSEKALSDAVIYLLTNKKRYALYKNAAIKVSRKFDINYILDEAFKKIPG